jgi:hypothetical protein
VARKAQAVLVVQVLIATVMQECNMSVDSPQRMRRVGVEEAAAAAGLEEEAVVVVRTTTVLAAEEADS